MPLLLVYLRGDGCFLSCTVCTNTKHEASRCQRDQVHFRPFQHQLLMLRGLGCLEGEEMSLVACVASHECGRHKLWLRSAWCGCRSWLGSAFSCQRRDKSSAGRVLQPLFGTRLRVPGSCPGKGMHTGNAESQEANTGVITGTIVRLRLVV